MLGLVERPAGVAHGVVLELRCILAPERRHDPRHDHRKPVGAGVDHACLAEHRQLVRPTLDGLGAGDEGALEHLGEELVLLAVGSAGRQPLPAHVRQVASDAVRHRSDRGEHRALGGVAHGVVRGVRGACQSRRHQNGIDQLAGSRHELLRRAAHDLRQDHPAVAPRSEQRSAGDRVHELVSAEVVQGLAVDPLELVEHGAHRHSHVVAGVAVGDGKDVEVVHLLTPALELGVRARDRALEPGDALVWHGRVLHRSANGVALGPPTSVT